MPPQPPIPPQPPVPPAPADPLRAVAVAVLNLSGLGLGYALIRRWLAFAVSLAVTAVLLLVALPADADGVSGGVVVTYVVFLLLFAAHGAFRGLRTRMAWPPQSFIAVAMGLVLLAVPAGGVVLYGGWQDEATEQMLLDRLDKTDSQVKAARSKTFSAAQPDYRRALDAYRDLRNDHPGSRAAKRVPTSLDTYYETVAAKYDDKEYCDAIEPLKYLRTTVPETIGKKTLGKLVTWPDDRLATSFYECGRQDLQSGGSTNATGGYLKDLLTTFPESEQAGKVEPAVKDAVDEAVKGVKGDEPCAAVDRLKGLKTEISALPGEKAGIAPALDKDADKAGKNVQSGAYACGVDEYKDGDFDKALTTMNNFLDTYKSDSRRTLAKKIAIAAEIAKSTPAAGKKLPTTRSGGGITVTVKNDSPEQVEVLYTGPVTGSFTLKGCKGCTTYSSSVSASLSACKGGKNYPQRTLSLPVGTTYFLHKPISGTVTTPGSDTATLKPGFIYTECAYLVSGLGF